MSVRLARLCGGHVTSRGVFYARMQRSVDVSRHGDTTLQLTNLRKIRRKEGIFAPASRGCVSHKFVEMKALSAAAEAARRLMINLHARCWQRADCISTLYVMFTATFAAAREPTFACGYFNNLQWRARGERPRQRSRRPPLLTLRRPTTRGCFFRPGRLCGYRRAGHSAQSALHGSRVHSRRARLTYVLGGEVSTG